MTMTVVLSGQQSRPTFT